MDVDALLLARLQFAFTIAVHIIFPAFSIGSSAYVATPAGHVATDRRTTHFHRLGAVLDQDLCRVPARRRVSAFRCPTSSAPTGAASRRVVGNVIGPLIGYEVLTALLPGGHLSRGDAVRMEEGAALAARDLGRTGCAGHHDLALSGSCRRTAGCTRRPAMRSATASRTRWTGGRLSSIRASLSVRPHDDGGVPHDRPLSCMAVGARYLLAGKYVGRREDDDANGPGDGRNPRALSASGWAISMDSTRFTTSPSRWRRWRGIGKTTGPADLVLFGIPDLKAEKTHAEIAIPKIASLISRIRSPVACPR